VINKIFLINLERRSDRLDKFKKEALKSNIIKNYVRYPAFDGKLIDESTIKSIADPTACKNIIENKTTCGLYLSRGAIGLALTYRKIFEECQSKTMLLEDDITIEEEFDEILSLALKELPKDWDILYLGWHISNNLNIKKISDNIFEMNGQINGTQGWIINENSAKKLLKIFPIKYQIDTEIYMHRDLKKYCVKKQIVKNYSDVSDIQV
jgi:GR25 family glycosyltransferase involved in LPS biosynthesis